MNSVYYGHQEFDKMYPFHATGFFPYPMNIQENLWFLMFSGGIEKEQ